MVLSPKTLQRIWSHDKNTHKAAEQVMSLTLDDNRAALCNKKQLWVLFSSHNVRHKRKSERRKSPYYNWETVCKATGRLPLLSNCSWCCSRNYVNYRNQNRTKQGCFLRCGDLSAQYDARWRKRVISPIARGIVYFVHDPSVTFQMLRQL